MGKRKANNRKSGLQVLVESARDIELKQRTAEAVSLRVAGWTYADIADHLGYESELDAGGAVRRAMMKLDKETRENLAQIRQMDLQRLDWLWRKIHDKIENAGDKGVESPMIAAAVKVIERRAKLIGADAPTKHEHDVQFGMSRMEAENSSDVKIAIRLLQKCAVEHGENPMELAKRALLELGDMAPTDMVRHDERITTVELTEDPEDG